MRKVFYLALISAIYLMFLLFSSLLFAEDVTFVIGGENGKIRSLRGINIGPLSSGALTASFSIPIIEGVDISNLKGVTLFVGYGLSEQDMLSRNLYSLLYQF